MKNTTRLFLLMVSTLLLVPFAISTPLHAQTAQDLTGWWRNKTGEDGPERGQGPDVGDYTGMPVNDAARAKADSWKASVQSLLERQCIPHPFPYSLRGPGGLRIWSDVDPFSGAVVDWKVDGTWGRAVHTIYMDGRPRPSKYALHTYNGFTTGDWQGNTLTTYTDHIQYGYLRRNGVPTSDQTTVIEHWMRHGDNLTAVVFVQDPVYLTEPFIRSSNWGLDPNQRFGGVDLNGCEVAEEQDLPEGVIPHWLPGTNPYLNEMTRMYGIPAMAIRGGAETSYPEYRKKLEADYKAPDHCVRYCCAGGAALNGCDETVQTRDVQAPDTNNNDSKPSAGSKGGAKTKDGAKVGVKTSSNDKTHSTAN